MRYLINRVMSLTFYLKRYLRHLTDIFFDVEYYLLNSEKRHEMKNKYVNIILKLMCYYRTSILWNGWNDNPKPEDIDAAVSEIYGKSFRNTKYPVFRGKCFIGF